MSQVVPIAWVPYTNTLTYFDQYIRLCGAYQSSTLRCIVAECLRTYRRQRACAEGFKKMSVVRGDTDEGFDLRPQIRAISASRNDFNKLKNGGDQG